MARITSYNVCYTKLLRVDERLHAIMKNIHVTCVKYGTEPSGKINYIKGANIGGFVKVADAMIAQGVV